MYIAIESGVERVLETKKIYNKFGSQVFCMQNYIRLIKSNDGFYLFIYLFIYLFFFFCFEKMIRNK